MYRDASPSVEGHPFFGYILLFISIASLNSFFR